MKKFITIAFAGVLTVLGAAPAFAQVTDPTPEQCVEADDIAPEDVADCADVADNGEVYPVVLPDTAPTPTEAPTTLAPTPAPTVPPAGLPATGSSGATGLMQIGGLLLAGGLVVFVAARRRNTATAS